MREHRSPQDTGRRRAVRPVGLKPGTNKAEPVGSEVILNVFDTLVAWTAPDFKALEGRLAESWTVSPKAGIDFKLREGVKFHDGTDFDAEAVKFSLERTKSINTYVEATFGLISDIAVVSPTEVKITLQRTLSGVPLGSWPSRKQPSSAPPPSRNSAIQFAVNPVGTGPFKFKSQRADTNIVLDANADYFRGAPKLERIIYRVIPDASTRRLELENRGASTSFSSGPTRRYCLLRP